MSVFRTMGNVNYQLNKALDPSFQVKDVTFEYTVKKGRSGGAFKACTAIALGYLASKLFTMDQCSHNLKKVYNDFYDCYNQSEKDNKDNKDHGAFASFKTCIVPNVDTCNKDASFNPFYESETHSFPVAKIAAVVCGILAVNAGYRAIQKLFDQEVQHVKITKARLNGENPVQEAEQYRIVSCQA